MARMTKQLESCPIARMFRREINFVRKNSPQALKWCPVFIRFHTESRDSIFRSAHVYDNGQYVPAKMTNPLYRRKSAKSYIEVELLSRTNYIKAFDYFGQMSMTGQTISEAMVQILAHELYHHYQHTYKTPEEVADSAHCKKGGGYDYGLRGALERPACVFANMMLLKWRGSAESRKVPINKEEYFDGPVTETKLDFSSPLGKLKSWKDDMAADALWPWRSLKDLIFGHQGELNDGMVF